MPTTVVLPQVVLEGTRLTASIPNPGTSSGGAVTAQVFGLSVMSPGFYRKDTVGGR